MLQFGIGGLFANPVGGNASTPTWPQQFATIQDINIDITQKLVELMGQNKMPDDVAPSDEKITAKAGKANIQIDMYNTLFAGETITTGGTTVTTFPGEQWTIPTGTAGARVNTTSYVVGNTINVSSVIYKCVTAGTSAGSPPTFNTTVGALTADGTVVWQSLGPAGNSITVTNSGTFVSDMGVQYLTQQGTVKFLQRVASAPTVGQYTVSAGVYQFNTTDIGRIVLISYTYTTVSGRTLSRQNHIQGYGPVFECYIPLQYQGGGSVLHLRQCRSSKIGFPLKRDGYLIEDFEFTVYPDASGVAWDLYQNNA